MNENFVNKLTEVLLKAPFLFDRDDCYRYAKEVSPQLIETLENETKSNKH